MNIAEIKKIVRIRNKEIEFQIKDIENIYNIEITNELLENIIIFSLNSIKYYNEKYNAYKLENEYEQLYCFGDDFSNLSNYNYNLLNSANYNNKEYKNFIKSIDNKQVLNTISFIFSIIQIQIEIFKNKIINIKYNTREVNYNTIHEKDTLKLNLPIDEMILFLIYYYKNNKHKNVMKTITKDIQINLDLLKIGRCLLIEDIYFNYIDNYEITNMKSEYYLELLESNNESYNKQLHERLLKDIKGLNI